MNFAHPVFAPYQQEIAALTLAGGLPPLSRLNTLAETRGLVNTRNLPLRFTMPSTSLTARDYEQQILQTGCIPTRQGNWHDMMNALVWLRFTAFKATLNAAHVEAMVSETGARRGRRRDALTILDESGVWVASKDDALHDALRQRQWQMLFCTQRAQVIQTMQFVVVGHALLEKMLQPYPTMTGKCLLMRAELSLDSVEHEACLALQPLHTPEQLAPLPVLGIPGWDPHNACAGYYTNETIFRQRERGA